MLYDKYIKKRYVMYMIVWIYAILFFKNSCIFAGGILTLDFNKYIEIK